MGVFVVAKAEFKFRDFGMNRALEELKALGKGVSKVGFPEGTSSNYEDGSTVASVAYVNEYGSQTRSPKIPARPFMRQTIERTEKTLPKVKEHYYKLVVAGKMTAKTALGQLGEWYAGEMKRTIGEGSFKANSPVTIASKQSSHPLIDTGHMRNSITHREEWKE